MKKKKAPQVFHEELTRLIARITSNYDITFAEMLGVLCIKRAELEKQLLDKNKNDSEKA